MRLQTLAVYNMTRHKKSDQLNDPKKLMLFDWEKDPVEPPRILTEDEWKQLDEKIARITANQKPLGSKEATKLKI